MSLFWYQLLFFLFWRILGCIFSKDTNGCCCYLLWFGIWLGWVLWHMNYWRLFNAKSSFYIYIFEYIGFGWVGFYGISTRVDYLMQNRLYAYILLPCRGKDTSMSVLDMTLKMWWWGSSDGRALGNAEYLFIAIAPWSTLTRSGNIW